MSPTKTYKNKGAVAICREEAVKIRICICL